MPLISNRHLMSSKHRVPLYPKPRLKIGLLGGSFNPSHEGHLYVAMQAKKRLGLEQVWWLITPGNPLKDPSTMLPLDERVALAEELTSNIPYIKIVDIENAIGGVRTYDTIQHIAQLFEESQFTWLMGADNLATIDRWFRWKDLVDSVNMAVFDRSSLKYQAIASKGFVYGNHRISFLNIKKHPFSATYIRNSWKKDKKCV